MSVYKRKSGRWAVLVEVDRGADGKRRRRPLGTFPNKKEAERAEREALGARDRGIDLHPDRIDVGTLLDRYVRDRTGLGRGAKTVERYGDLVRLYIKPHIGSIPLAKLKPAHVSELVTILGERGGVKERALAPKSVHHVYSLLRGALAWAFRQELVGRNVADAVEAPSLPRGTAVALTVDEANAMLIEGDKTRWGSFLRIALGCGARRGELLALRWTDVDMEGCTLTIRGSLSQTRAGVTEKATKTDRVRIVALPALAVEALRHQRATQAEDRLKSGGEFVDSGHVFQGPLGGSIRPYSATDAFRKLARKVGISTTKLHALRHTTGSWLIASGVDPRTAASVLGHASPLITLSIYSHLVVGMQKAAVANIDDRLNAARTKTP
jgi:integrase